MSAYTICNDVLLSIASGLAKIATESSSRPELAQCWQTKRELNRAIQAHGLWHIGNKNLFPAESVLNLVSHWATLNRQAVNVRYNEIEHIEAPAEMFSILKPGFASVVPSSIHQLFKNMACLRYQMSEGDINQDPLYDQLSAIMGALALDVMENSAEYDRAKWGAV